MKKTIEELYAEIQYRSAGLYTEREPTPEPTGPELRWERCKDGITARAQVPGGWLVRAVEQGGSIGNSMTFLPDPSHSWGSSDAADK